MKNKNKSEKPTPPQEDKENINVIALAHKHKMDATILLTDPPEIQENPPENKYFNPEKSWLAFNQRVLDCAEREDYPLLERLKFLSIAANNLDEFYMVFFGRLYDETHDIKNNHDYSFAIRNSGYKTHPNLPLQEHIKSLQEIAHVQINSQVKLWVSLRKELRHNGIDVISPKGLSKKDFQWLEQYFTNAIFPILTPMAIDSSHPVPLIPSGGIAMAVQLKSPNDDSTVHAFIPLPPQLNRFIELPGEKHRFIAMEHVISLFLESLFSNYTVISQGLFRVIRNSQMHVSKQYDTDLKDPNLRDEYEYALKRRLHGEIIQLEVNERMPEYLRLYVCEQFDADPAETLVIDGFVGVSCVAELVKDRFHHLLFPPFQARFPQRIKHQHSDIFESIALKDILIHHPYESFDVIIQLLNTAAKDINVLSIKIALYRTGSDSPIIKALIEAAKKGKSVTAIVEIKARFDEETNIKWTKDLENAGIHVIYGIKGLKTHGKLCLIARQEEKGMRTYAHFGTGNYNAKTAKVYTDLSLLTADKTLCQDAARIFHYMTGYARTDNLEKIVVSPFNLRSKIMELIENEISNAKQGLPGHIWLKMNALTDTKLIKELYKASQAGVQIDLIVRNMCSLIPGIPGLSETIRVKSIVGRFLEHSRIFCFGNGQKMPSDRAKVYISSADWMPRNLDWRFELMIPIENPTVHQQILEQIMLANFNDRANSWELESSGIYLPLKISNKDFNAQEFFMGNESLSGSGLGPYPIFPHRIKPNGK